MTEMQTRAVTTPLMAILRGSRRIANAISSIYWTEQFAECGSGFRAPADACITGADRILVGNSVRFGHGMRLEAIKSYHEQIFKPEITIGDGVTINDNCHIAAIGCVRIGDGVLVAGNVFISDHDHGDLSPEQASMNPAERPLRFRGRIDIADNVWLGEQVVVLGGVSIGQGAVIGAGAVVTRDVPPYSIAVGTPARVVRSMSTDRNEADFPALPGAALP